MFASNNHGLIEPRAQIPWTRTLQSYTYLRDPPHTFMPTAYPHMRAAMFPLHMSALESLQIIRGDFCVPVVHNGVPQGYVFFKPSLGQTQAATCRSRASHTCCCSMGRNASSCECWLLCAQRHQSKCILYGHLDLSHFAWLRTGRGSSSRSLWHCNRGIRLQPIS